MINRLKYEVWQHIKNFSKSHEKDVRDLFMKIRFNLHERRYYLFEKHG